MDISPGSLRDAIMREARITIDLSDMKECLNWWLNGAKKYKRKTDGRWNTTDNQALERWFRRFFPEMAKVGATFPRSCGIPTRNGKNWYPATVRNILKIQNA